MAIDQPGAVGLFVAESRTFIDNNDATWIVIHKTAGFQNVHDLGAYFASTPLETSVHYGIGLNGELAQFVQEKNGAAGNCCVEQGHAAFLPTDVNLNTKTISIELIDPSTDNSTPVPDAQLNTLITLVKGIAARHNIPLRIADASGGILYHHDIAPLSRARCPGNFPYDQFISGLSVQPQVGGTNMLDLNDPTVANYFEAGTGGVWKCKQNGIVIGGGILSYYRSLAIPGGYAGLTDLGLPLSGEIGLQSGGGVYQKFERGIVAYDPGHHNDNPPGAGPVYKMHVDASSTQQGHSSSSASI